MLRKRLSSLVFAAVSCWVLLGCLGGQAGDEGLNPDKQNAGKGGSGGSGGEDITAGTGGTAGVDGAAASGDQIPIAGTAAPVPPSDPGSGTEAAGYSCVVEIWQSPKTELERYTCSISGSDPYYEGSGQAGSGSNSELKEWQCDCNGVSQTVEASECAEALLNGCGVAQDTEVTFCRNNGDAIGVCWKKEDKGWQCGCGDPVDRVALVDQYDQECRDALFHACAQPCEGLLGECTPLLETDVVGFQCDCTYYGAIARKSGARMCQSALRDACHPNYANYSESCNGYVGYCDRSEQGYECHCLDGIEASIASVEMSEVGCYTALEQVCGENQPPEDSVCRVETSDESSIGQGYCVQIGEDLYECGCTVQTTVSTVLPPISTGGVIGSATPQSEPVNSPDAGSAITPPGATPPSVDGGGAINTTSPVTTPPPPSQQNELRIAASCEQALVMACPDLIRATPEQKSKACEIADDCYPMVVENSCLARIRDDCAICIIDAIDSGAQCGDERLVNCITRCANLSDPPTEPEECKARLDLIDIRSASTECLCDRCLESIAPCGVDVGCLEIAVCAYEHGCTGMDCFTQDTCEDVINKWLSGGSIDSITMAQALSDCGVAQGCL